MRVLIAHAGNMYGGVERVLDTVAQAPRFFPALKPAFALCFEGRPAESLRRHGASPTMLGDVRITRPDLILRARRRFAAVIKDTQPDVIVTPSVWTNAIFAPVARRARLPLVQWVHDALSATTFLECLAGRHQPDLMICNSRFSLNAARSVFPRVPAEVISCPLAFESPQASRLDVRRELSVPPDSLVIVNVARMEPLKGHHVLIEALAGLRADPRWTCWIVGGAQRPDEQRYQQGLGDLVTATGLQGRVRFLGHRTDVPSLLAASDLYCHPNRGVETFGLSIVEALHAGLPVIASGLGGPEEVLGDRCGRLVPAGDVDALTQAMAQALDDQDWRRRMADLGPARAIELCDPTARLADFTAALRQVRLQAAA